ncbi:MAG TPA: outer membrane protein transport protein [Kofleriaceae bacterium]|nr:outer membrane protein transport protein [Kofleriaceae bacterium]
MVCALVALAPVQAHADGIAIVGGSPRAIGRAGAATVGDDGGGALLVNPAAMARRDTMRAQLGLALVEDEVEWQSDTEASALSNGQAGSRLAPLGAAIGAIGNWILGAGVMTAAVSERSMPHPADMHGDLGSAYDYRYTGIAGSIRRDTIAIGAARRIGTSIALGLSLGASQVSVTEQRRIWAGFGGRDPIGDPVSDVDLRLSGTERFAPIAVAGVLYAADDAPIELGASVAWARTVRVEGPASAIGSSSPLGPTVRYTCSPRSSLELAQPLTVRAGGRYVGDRIVAELDGDLWVAPHGSDAAGWRLTGMRVIDSSQLFVDLRRLPSRIALDTHVAMRTAVDVELIPGFLWATGGYALTTPGTPGARLSPSFADLGGHTLGLGVEAAAGGFTVTFGWSRTWALAARAPTAFQLDNPFGGGDGPVPPGTYDGALDQIGLLIEAELGGTHGELTSPRAP